eukprot:g24682.t1
MRTFSSHPHKLITPFPSSRNVFTASSTPSSFPRTFTIANTSCSTRASDSPDGVLNVTAWGELLRAGSEKMALASARLQRHGMVSFPQFLRPEALRDAVEECQRLAGDAFRTDAEHNAYQLPSAATLPANHVRNLRMRTRVASTAWDELGASSVLRRLYNWPRLEPFMSALTGKACFRLADPLGCCSINVFHTGWEHAWHFDEAETTVTLCLQDAERGGYFEYTPPLRSSDQDMVYPKVASVLRSHSIYQPQGQETEPFDEAVETHRADFSPGTLMVFKGRYSLHRVTEVLGGRPRLVAVLCFADRPGVVNSPAVQQMFWGRTLTAN